MPIIAEGLGCSPETVRKTLSGERGNRPTILQHNIIKVAEKRGEQNEELIEFCQTIQVNTVSPAPVALPIPE